MSNRLVPIAVGISLLSVAACSDSHLGSEPPPPPQPRMMGTLKGTVEGKKVSFEYVPPASRLGTTAPGFSPQIYQDTSMIRVFGTVDSIVDTVGVSNTWYIRVASQNLLSFPIGASQGAAAPSDTQGVFLVFTQLPVKSVSYFCPTCTVFLINQMGTGNFGSPMQPYFWYYNRPTAMQGTPSTDTTDDRVWIFRTTHVTAPNDSLRAFTFVLEVSAWWPPGQDTIWLSSYNGTTDSLPDTQASPLWKRWVPTNGGFTLGTQTFNSGSNLTLADASGTNVSYYERDDSIGFAGFLNIDANVQIDGTTCTSSTTAICAVFGLAEQDTGRYAAIGVSPTQVGYVIWNQATGTWSFSGVPGAIFTGETPGTFDGTQPHIFRIAQNKLHADLCVDGTPEISITRPNLPLSAGTDFIGRQVFWGDAGDAGATGSTTKWKVLRYSIATNGGNCPTQ